MAEKNIDIILLQRLEVEQKEANKRLEHLDKQLSPLDGRIHAMEKRIEALESKRKGWLAWIAIGAPIATLIVGVVTLTIHFDNKIGGVQKDIQGTNIRLQKVEDSVKTLANAQSDQTQKLIHDLLGAAKNSSPAVAAKAARTAASLMAALSAEKRPASPGFFQATVQDVDALRRIKEPQMKAVAFQTQQELAAYRSSIQSPRIIGTEFHCQSDGQFTNRLPKGTFIFVSTVTVINCRQTLDNVYWENAVFINSSITYNGGPVVLKNVTFVNCEFNVEENDAAFGVLRYAALDQKEFKVRPDVFTNATPFVPGSGL